MICLEPVFKDYLWGGHKLKDFYQKKDMDIVAESWVLSVHKDGINKIKGRDIFLDTYLKDKRLWGSDNQHLERFPVMVKLIDADRNLSVQVHPNDEQGKLLEGENGKNEMWVILDSEEDAYIYYGLNKDLTKEELRKSILDSTILSHLNKIPVKKGEVYYVPSGTIHAIGKGCLLAEVQQTSNITYRLYDYDRIGKDGKKRKLDIDKALEVADLHRLSLQTSYLPEDDLLKECEWFTVNRKIIKDRYDLMADAHSFKHLLVLEGKGKINGRKASFGDSFLVPARSGPVRIEGNLVLLITERRHFH